MFTLWLERRRPPGQRARRKQVAELKTRAFSPQYPTFSYLPAAFRRGPSPASP